MLNKHLKSTCKDYRKNKVILAVSGGRDSMVLLNCIIKEKIFASSNLIIGHISHNIRSNKETQKDLEVVKRACKKHNIKLEHREIDPKYWQIHKGNQEARARTLRYQLLESVRQQHKADVIITAHHQDDQIETICINYLRGAGLKGLCGMPTSNFRKIVRPLLQISQQEIKKYQEQNQIEFTEDKSNKDSKYLRNQVRLFLQSHSAQEVITLSRQAEKLYIAQWLHLLNEPIRTNITNKQVCFQRQQLKGVQPNLVALLIHHLTQNTSLQRSTTINAIGTAIKSQKSGQEFYSKEQYWYIGPKKIRIMSKKNIKQPKTLIQDGDNYYIQTGIQPGDTIISNGKQLLLNRFCKKHKIDLHQRREIRVIKSPQGQVIAVPELELHSDQAYRLQ
jgi:tRNA(Ile)-lysidine synthase